MNPADLTHADAVAIVATILATAYTFQRRQMLRPSMGKWHSASGLVRGVLAGQAMFFGFAFWTIVGGSHCSWREACAYVFSAVVSAIMVHNLDRTGRRAAAGAAHRPGTNGSAVAAAPAPDGVGESGRSFDPPRTPPSPPN